MSSYDRYHSHSHSQSYAYAPSAPPLPEEPPHTTTAIAADTSHYYHDCAYGQVSSISSSSGYSAFPPGTHPHVISTFQMLDNDGSGFIGKNELQHALSCDFHNFNLSTIRLLMFLFKNPNHPLRIGPQEFAALWSCLGHWRGIFERYDKDRSGKIGPLQLRDALYGIGYAVPASVLELLISKYGDGSGRRVELGFDSFVECGMIIKGLTKKFKENDPHYIGSTTLQYVTFMSMVIPFLASYD